MQMQSEYILEMKHCRKEFPGVVALDDVSLFVKRGEVHALLGENGAGKSTIMKILAGIHTLDSGEILLNGQPFRPRNPADSINNGISMIHQELDLVPDMTVEQNLFAGREKTGVLGCINKKAMERETQKVLEDMNLDIPASAYVRDLSVAKMQMLAIAKAIMVESDIIIMDEPTAAIPEKEVEELFSIIRRLKERGKSIIYISHRLEEIFQITDMITVLRDGRFVGSKKTAEVTNDELVKLMVGRELKNYYSKDAAAAGKFDGEALLEVKNLSSGETFRDISFEVHRGEILGISGLMGAGRSEIMQSIFGLRPIDSGEVRIRGKKVKVRKPGDAIKEGMAFVTEDRKMYGLSLINSIRFNISTVYSKLITFGNFVLNLKKERKRVREIAEKLRIKCPDYEVSANSLSGGNQQKVVLAKWLMGAPDILIMDEPTRGVDVGAKAEIYQIMDDLVKQGKAIIMISSEMPELLGMSDSVVVICQGKITGRFAREECSQVKIMNCAIGQGGSFQ